MHSGLDPGDYQIGPRCGYRMHLCLDAISACVRRGERKKKKKNTQKEGEENYTNWLHCFKLADTALEIWQVLCSLLLE